MNVPLLGVIDSTGTFYAEQGGLGATWVNEDGPRIGAIAVASDPTSGPLLGVLDSGGNFWAKEGVLGGTHHRAT